MALPCEAFCPTELWAILQDAIHLSSWPTRRKISLCSTSARPKSIWRTHFRRRPGSFFKASCRADEVDSGTIEAPVKRTPVERLREAREFAGKIRQIALGMDPDIFEGVEYYHYAVRYCFLVVGEALKFVPDEIQATAPEIPWRPIINMRHRLAHD